MKKEDLGGFVNFCLRILKCYVIYLRVILFIKGMNSVFGEFNIVFLYMEFFVYNKCLIFY